MADQLTPFKPYSAHHTITSLPPPPPPGFKKLSTPLKQCMTLLTVQTVCKNVLLPKYNYKLHTGQLVLFIGDK